MYFHLLPSLSLSPIHAFQPTHTHTHYSSFETQACLPPPHPASTSLQNAQHLPQHSSNNSHRCLNRWLRPVSQWPLISSSHHHMVHTHRCKLLEEGRMEQQTTDQVCACVCFGLYFSVSQVCGRCSVVLAVRYVRNSQLNHVCMFLCMYAGSQRRTLPPVDYTYPAMGQTAIMSQVGCIRLRVCNLVCKCSQSLIPHSQHSDTLTHNNALTHTPKCYDCRCTHPKQCSTSSSHPTLAHLCTMCMDKHVHPHPNCHAHTRSSTRM